jgi:hypothetical protein
MENACIRVLKMKSVTCMQGVTAWNVRVLVAATRREIGHFEVELVVFPLVTYIGHVSFSIGFYRPMHTVNVYDPATGGLVGWFVRSLVGSSSLA